MAATASADEVADLLLRMHRDPAGHRRELAGGTAAHARLELVVRLALGKPVSFASAALREPAAARALETAAIGFLRQSLFTEGASHYQALGLDMRATPAQIREHFRTLMQLIHPDRQDPASGRWPARAATQVNRAYAVLKNPVTRAAYDAQIGAPLAGPTTTFRTAPHSPDPARVARRRLPLPWLPEWLTAGVGGFVRDHPAATIFSALVVVAGIAVTLAARSEHDAMLVRNDEQGMRSLGAVWRPPKPQPAYIAGLQADRAARDGGAEPAVAGGAAGSAAGGGAVGDKVIEAAARTADPAMIPASPAVAAASVAAAPIPVATPRPITTRTGTMTAAAAPVAAGQPPAPARVFALAGVASAAAPAASPAAVPVSVPVAATPTIASAAIAAPTIAIPAIGPTPATSSPSTAIATHAIATQPTPTHAATEPSGESPAPTSAEIEILIASYLSLFENGRGEALAALFDADAQSGAARGRAAIRAEFDELFGRTATRRITPRQLRWRTAGERIEVSGEVALKTQARDGREAEQRLALEMQVVRRNGRAVIARMAQRPGT